MNIQKSIKLFKEAKELLPGGVDSPVRAFNAVGGQPLFIKRGDGAYLYDVDDNKFIDYVLSWGPLVAGHAHPRVVNALQHAAVMGTSYGAPSALENELARQVMGLMPNIEMIRFVNSGTEATMSALRLARAFTGRNKIVKFEGNYHGHADMLLVKAGSGMATLGLPNSPGVPTAVVADTLIAPYNDLDAVKALFAKHKGEIAAVIVEPVSGNMGLVQPADGFLQGLRDVTANDDALLIFDEVMTGFRVHTGGAQTLYGIKPDITALGKVIGGGLPVGAYGGRRDIMEMVAPVGAMYQAGTLSGNPLAMTAGIETLKIIQKEGAWDGVMARGEQLLDGLSQAAADAGVPIQPARVGTMFGFFFADAPVTNWTAVSNTTHTLFGTYFHQMLEQGIYIAPSPFEVGFLSTTHGEAEIKATIEAASVAFAAL